MAKSIDKRQVSPKQQAKKERKWINYLLLDLDDVKKDHETTKKEIEELKERVSKLEQQQHDGCKCSNNSST